MAPSTIGRETMMLSGVRPIISLARLPTESILLSRIEIATTDGSLRIIPFLGRNTTVLVVPKSIPIFFTRLEIRWTNYKHIDVVMQTKLHIIIEKPVNLRYNHRA